MRRKRRNRCPLSFRLRARCCPNSGPILSFRAGGPIVELKVQSGDTVKAGDVIARLDDVDAKLAVAQAEAALAVAQAQLAQLKAGPRS